VVGRERLSLVVLYHLELDPPFERDGEHLQTSPFRVGALRLPRRHRADESRRIRQHIADLPVGIREVALALAVAALLLLDRGDARILISPPAAADDVIPRFNPRRGLVGANATGNARVGRRRPRR
jgi:hypothetical protein